MSNETNEIGLSEEEMNELTQVCEREGKTLAQKVREIILSFLSEGDNHRAAVAI